MSGLLQRFDGALMAPPGPAAAPLLSEDAALLAALRRWCLFDAARERQDGAPRPRQPMTIARLAGPHPRQAQLAEHLALELDGSLLLQARGRLGGLALRVRVKLQDAGLWPSNADTAIWDAGWLRAGATQACEQFHPRRATLLLVDASAQPQLPQAVAALRQASAGYARPLRVLLLNPPEHLAGETLHVIA
ncbi:hypothetical protein RQP53_13720 [Paucibacter sp. APW11]|uniref:Uncharacterized protein n=1 Tax=Roseateles aquae TaxID=3077235 RepID=A0ABU3PDC9_9BURK|nr:hypothetical protein [Paucibacter sp. APW11]MDT9000327.1 hypothetical protein [Paucibacter sp. APW11]